MKAQDLLEKYKEKHQMKCTDTSRSHQNDSTVYNTVPLMTRYPDGRHALEEYLEKGSYANEVVNQSKKGKIWIRFVVEKNGDLGSISLPASATSMDSATKAYIRNMQK